MARLASRSSRTRWLLGLAVMPAALSLVGGCDTPTGKADRSVEDNLRQAAEAAPGTPAERTKLDAAAAEKDASVPLQVQAKAMQAAAELRAAVTLADEAATKSAQIDRLARQIASLGDDVAADNRLVVNLGRYQPDKALEALQTQSTAIAGSEDKPEWVKTDGGNLLSTAATDKSATALQQQIGQLEQQVKSETDQRTELMAKADQLTEQSRREQHQKSVDLFTQGADARKQAGDLAVKIDQDNSLLNHAKADLAVQVAQQGALKTAATGIDSRKSSINEAWAAVQEKIKAVKAHSAAQMGEGGDALLKGPPTINGKAAELAKLVKENKGLRDEAITHFNAAIDFYRDAQGKASTLKNDLSTRVSTAADRPNRADVDAWKIEQDAVEPAQFQYLMAMTQLDQAQFYARSAAEAKAIVGLSARLKPILDAAGLQLPAALDDTNGEATKAVQDQQKLADGRFKDATDALENVTSGDASNELKHGANVGAMLAEYGWSLLAAGSGDAQNAAGHLEKAHTAQANALQSGGLPAMLPADLAPTPAAAPGAPAAPGVPATPAAPAAPATPAEAPAAPAAVPAPAAP